MFLPDCLLPGQLILEVSRTRRLEDSKTRRLAGGGEAGAGGGDAGGGGTRGGGAGGAGAGGGGAGAAEQAAAGQPIVTEHQKNTTRDPLEIKAIVFEKTAQ